MRVRPMKAAPASGRRWLLNECKTGAVVTDSDFDREDFRLCIECPCKCDWFKASYPLAGRANPLEGDGTDGD